MKTEAGALAVPEEVERNMCRSEEIVRCQAEIAACHKKLHRLKRDWKNQKNLTAIELLGSEAWHQLTSKERRNKANLLAMLECESLPSCLGASFWGNFPKHLREDLDLFLAQLKLPDFFLHDSDFLLQRLCNKPEWKSDKQIMQEVVRTNPWIILKDGLDLPEEFLHDRDLLMAFIEAGDSPYHPKRDVCLNLFSTKLRSDKELMISALRNGIRVFDALDRSLRNSRNFALQAAAVIAEYDHQLGNRLLRPFSHRLKSDPEVVEAFCKIDGSSLAFASYPLRRNDTIVRTAVRQDPTALVYALKCRKRGKLVRDKGFLLEILRENIVNTTVLFHDHHRWDRFWTLIPPAIQVDPEIALLRLRTASNSANLPPSLLSDRLFLLEACKIGKLGDLFVDELALSAVLDFEFCCDILQTDMVEPDLVDVMICGFPDYFSDRRLWENVNPNQYEDVLDELLDNAPQEILNDKQIMLRLCETENAIQVVASSLCGSPLLDDRDIVERLLGKDLDVFSYLSSTVQLLFPDLVAKCIGNACGSEYDIEYLEEIIEDDLWQNREVALAWVRSGGGEVTGDLFFVEEFFEDDPEMFLAVAEHSWDDFVMCSDRLLSDHSFLCKAATANGKIWTLLEDEAQQDFDISLAAFAGTPSLPYYCDEDSFSLISNFARSVREKLRNHEIFVKLVAGTIDRNSSSCPMSLLNQGSETSLVYKKEIAKYLDVATGATLRLLRQASLNLSKWGF